jgi:serine/threonine protein kinase
MSHRAPCPDVGCYQQALDGGLAADELEGLAAHLETCASCLATVRSLPADRLGQLLRAAPATDDTPLPPDVAHLIERILRLHPSGTTPAPINPGAATTDDPGIAPAPSAGVAFLEAPRQPDEIGRLGPFRVLRQLGEGGMGLVFQAEDVRLRRRVALKVMKPELAARPQARERFLREARAMAAVEHERIVPVYEADEATVGGATVPYLAMPLLQGETLADRLRRPEPLSLAEAVRIAREAAEGLAAAHAAGLIHRDVKPGNIWLEERPGEPGGLPPRSHVKILDFGLARAVEGDTDLSAPGDVFGTPAYMAPEQADGATVDARTDLFSLGCVLYELLARRLPFTASGKLALLKQVATHHPQPPHAVNPEVPPALSDLVMRLLAKEPAGRPASARDVAEALRGFEATPPGGSTPPPAEGTTTAWRPPIRWRWWAVLGGAVLAAGLLVAVAVVRWPRQPAALPLEPLHGSLDVQVAARDNSNDPDLCLDDFGAMPLRIGDQFCILAELNRPAYVYVLWINPDGSVQPIHPWRPDHWDERPGAEEKAQRLRWPAAADKYYTIKKDRAGMLTLVLLARELPLPREVDLRAELGELPVQKEQDLRATVWFENGIRAKNRRGREGMFDEVRRDDPVLAVQERIRERLLGRYFDYSLAVSFARRGD